MPRRLSLRDKKNIASLPAMNSASILEWHTLLAVQAGAAATLTGLVFVAVSINLSRIIEIPGLPGRAGESIVQFMGAFLTATVGLIPQQSEKSLAVEILLIAISSWTVQLTVQVRYLRIRSGHPWSWFGYRAVMSQLATLPFCVAGTELLLGMHGALYWLVPGFIFSFLAGVASAWVLLVEILR